jgi:hypothetical protein
VKDIVSDWEDWDALEEKLWEEGVDCLEEKLFGGILDCLDFKLTRDECKILLKLLKGERIRRMRRRGGSLPDPELPLRAEAIANLKALYQQDGMIPKAAVAEVMQRYGVSRSQVYDACRQYPNASAEVKGMGQMEPTWRRGLIRWYESMWPPKRQRRRQTRRIES